MYAPPGRLRCVGLLRLGPGEGLSACVADVENNNCVAFDGEQDAVNVRLAPVKKVAHFEGKLRILRGQQAALGKLGKRGRTAA